MTKVLVTVDIVLFTIRDRQLHLLLIRRLAKPYENRYALPGGFVREEESLDAAATRELRELQLVHEAILGENLDKRNFRRKIIQKGIVKPTKEWQRTGRKPAQFYRFSQ